MLGRGAYLQDRGGSLWQWFRARLRTGVSSDAYSPENTVATMPEPVIGAEAPRVGEPIPKPKR